MPSEYIDLDWEGTFGYGDIVGAITNALWHHRISGKQVRLNLSWHTDRKFYPPTNKYHSDDPETVLERVDFIKQQFVGHENIIMVHSDYVWEGEDEQLRPKFKNRWKTSKWYATVGDTVMEPSVGDHICVWHTLQNVDPVHKFFPTEYKDPLSNNGQWSLLFEKLSGHKVEYISYRDPIQETFEKIASSKLCIGYEGIGQLIAKNFWKPTVTFSTQSALSQLTSGPWAMLDDKVGKWASDLNREVETQLPKIQACKHNYEYLKNAVRKSGH